METLEKISPAQPLAGIDPAKLDELEAGFFELIKMGLAKEVEIPTTHTFTPNTYVREGLMPAGNLIIGHYHREPHVCVVLKGRMSILNPDRTVTEIVAPCVFMAAPGRKIGFMHEDVLMQNIHETKDWPAELKTDLDALEEHIYNRTAAWKKYQLDRPTLKAIA